jgi:hypothetical protein
MGTEARKPNKMLNPYKIISTVKATCSSITAMVKFLSYQVSSTTKNIQFEHTFFD